MWWLNAFFLVNGVWVAGHLMSPPGWSPRAYPSEQACVERKVFAEKECAARPLQYRARWLCSKDAPLDTAPPEVDERSC